METKDKFPHLQLIANIIKKYEYNDLKNIILDDSFQMLMHWNYEDKYKWTRKEWYDHLIKMFEYYEYFEICRCMKSWYQIKQKVDIK